MTGLAVPSVSLLRRAERLRVLVIALAGESPSPPTRRLSCLAVPLKTDQRPEFFLSKPEQKPKFFLLAYKKILSTSEKFSLGSEIFLSR